MGSKNKYMEIEYKCGDVLEVVRGNFPQGQNQALRHFIKCKRKRGKSLYKSSMSRTRNNIRRLINANYSEKSILVTFTFAENMQDEKKARAIFKNFLRRLIYRYPRFSSYLYVIERQKRGAFHFHVVFFQAVFLEFTVMSEMWGQGFVQLESIDSISNLGCYLSSELAKVYQKEGITGKRYGFSKNLNRFQKKKFSSDHVRTPDDLARVSNIYNPGCGRVSLLWYSKSQAVLGMGDEFEKVPF